MDVGKYCLAAEFRSANRKSNYKCTSHGDNLGRSIALSTLAGTVVEFSRQRGRPNPFHNVNGVPLKSHTNVPGLYLLEIYLIQGKNALPGGVGNRERIGAIIARIQVHLTNTHRQALCSGQSLICICSMVSRICVSAL